jgi:hypothetical protein
MDDESDDAMLPNRWFETLTTSPQEADDRKGAEIIKRGAEFRAQRETQEQQPEAQEQQPEAQEQQRREEQLRRNAQQREDEGLRHREEQRLVAQEQRMDEQEREAKEQRRREADLAEVVRRGAEAVARQEAEARSKEIATLAQQLNSMREDVSRIEAKHARPKSETQLVQQKCSVAYSAPDGSVYDYAEEPESDASLLLPGDDGLASTLSTENEEHPAPLSEDDASFHSSKFGTIGILLAAAGVGWIGWTYRNLHGCPRSDTSAEGMHRPDPTVPQLSTSVPPRAAAPPPTLTTADSDSEDIDVVAAAARIEVRLHDDVATVFIRMSRVVVYGLVIGFRLRCSVRCRW